MNSTATATARRRLDEKVGGLPRELLTSPGRGWVAAVRQALGMSLRDLGARMGVSAQRASKLEQDEASGRVQLASLERAAEAMDCRLVYLFVPNESFDSIVKRQAVRKAERVLAPTWHSMALEDQEVDLAIRSEQVEALASQMTERRGLWSD